MNSDLLKSLKIPKQPANSSSIQIANLRKKNLSEEEIKSAILEVWVNHAKKLDEFWATLPIHVDRCFKKRIEDLEYREIVVLDQESALYDREIQLRNEEVDKFTDDLFSRLDALLEKGVTPDTAVQLIMAILKLKEK